MEQGPSQPPKNENPPNLPERPPALEREAFFARLKKRLRSPGGESKKKAEKPEQAKPQESKEENPEAPQEQSSKKEFGRKILEVLKLQQPKQNTSESNQAEAPASDSPTSKTTETVSEVEPTLVHAERVRGFARIVIEFVRDEAKQAEEVNEAAPGSVEPEVLEEAADDLDMATEELSEIIDEVKLQNEQSEVESILHEETEVAIAQESIDAPDGDGGDGGNSETETISAPESNLSKTILKKVSQIESRSEINEAVTLATFMLGAIAVVIAGHEYGARKRVQKDHKVLKRMMQLHARKEEEYQELEERHFLEAKKDHLRQEESEKIGNKQRQKYYQELSEFTHDQAAVTRETSSDLIAADALANNQNHAESRQSTKSESVKPSSTRQERSGSGDKQEAKSARTNQGRSAALGGGSAPIGNVVQNPTTPTTEAKAPLSPAALRKLEEKQQKRKKAADDIWIYGLGLFLALLGLILSFILAF